jgi:hypothetical protein
MVDMVKLLSYDKARSFHLGYVFGILRLAARATAGTGRRVTQEQPCILWRNGRTHHSCTETRD